MNASNLDKISKKTTFQIVFPLVMFECIYFIYSNQYQVILIGKLSLSICISWMMAQIEGDKLV